MKIPLKIIVAIISLGGINTMEAHQEEMYIKIQSAVQSICKEYNCHKITLIVSNDDQVKANQSGVIHITKLNQAIAQKEQMIASLDTKIIQLQQEIQTIEHVLGLAYEHLNLATNALRSLQNASDKQAIRTFLVNTKN